MNRTYLGKGLVAYWKMDEATGQNRVNALNPGTLDLLQTGGVIQDAETGHAFVFSTQCNDTTVFMNISDNATLNTGRLFSLAGWFATSDSTKSTYVVKYSDHVTTFDYGSGLVIGNASVGGWAQVKGVDTANHAAQAQGPHWQIVTGSWYHVAVVCDGNTLTIYVNAVPVAVVTLPDNMPTNNRDLAFVANVAAASIKVAQWGFWSRPLRSSDVAALYNGGQGLAGPPS